MEKDKTAHEILTGVEKMYDLNFHHAERDFIIKAMNDFADQFRVKKKDVNKQLIFENLNPEKADFIPILLNWLRYKGEKNQSYKPIGLKGLIKRFNSFEGTVEQLEKIVDNSIDNNYSGIVWDKKIDNGNKQQSTYEKHGEAYNRLFGSGSPFESSAQN